MSALESRLEALRAAIRVVEGHSFKLPDNQVLPFADDRLNKPLPHGGLAMGELHEVTAPAMEAELAAPMAAFAACLAGRIMQRSPKPVLWAVSRADCHGPGLLAYGLDPSQVIWVECRKDVEMLAVMEEALQTPVLSAVIGEIGRLSLKSARRLAAAARRSGVTAFLLRRQMSKSDAGASPSGAALTRWRVSAAPSETSEPGLGPPRWRLDLEYCRNGKPSSFIVEASHETQGEAGHVRVVAELGDDAGSPEAAAARRRA